MSESSSTEQPNLSAVIDRLDRLELALRELIEVVRGAPMRSAPTAPAPVAPPEVHAGRAGLGEPPVIQVAPPQSFVPRPPTAPVTQVAPPSRGPIVDDSLRPQDPHGDRTDLEPPPANATVRQVLTRVFEAALMEQPNDTFTLMTRLTHPSQMQGPRALDHFKAFNWQKLRRGVHAYLQNGDPTSFTIAYTEPGEITATDDRVRVFLKVDGRMPVPIGFARDPAQAGAWRVTMISL